MGLFKQFLTYLKVNRLATAAVSAFALVVSLIPMPAKSDSPYTPEMCASFGNYSCQIRSRTTSKCMWASRAPGDIGILYKTCGVVSNTPAGTTYAKLSASAATPGSYYIRFSADGDMCLTSPSNVSGPQLWRTPCSNSTPNQRWYFKPGTISNHYRIRSVSSGMYAHPHPFDGDYRVRQQRCAATDTSCEWHLTQ